MNPPRLPVPLLAIVLLAGTTSLAAPQLGSRTADEWIKALDNPSRLEGLRIPEVVASLQLKPGDVVADIGAGAGAFSLPLARAVAPGSVFAVEVDQRLVDHIGKKARDQQITNVQPVLGAFDDPGLQPGSVNLTFIHDVLHHMDQRPAYVKALARTLKPDGRIAVIEFHPDRGGHKDQKEMQVTKEAAAKWMADVGLFPIQEVADLFTDKWFVIYGRR
jgi:ubiquinone/menaquinone biosynthesis C-methylase UbiE